MDSRLTKVGHVGLGGHAKSRLPVPLYRSFVRQKRRLHHLSARLLVMSVFLFFFCTTLPRVSRPFPHVGLFAMTFDSVRRIRRNIIVTFTQISVRYSRLIRTLTLFLPAPVLWICMNINRHELDHSLIFALGHPGCSLRFSDHASTCLMFAFKLNREKLYLLIYFIFSLICSY